jgi:putative transcriptional regulator
MENAIPTSLKGQFITAMPSLLDPNFYQTVTCISEHTPEGAIGLVVNRVHQSLSGADIFRELDIDYVESAESVPIFIGGPVHVGEIFILHGPPFEWESSLRVATGIAMSNTRDIIQSIAMDKGPKSYAITLGCAGWGPGQLESEIKQNAWLTSPVNEEVIFEMPVEDRWETTIQRMGIDPSLLTNISGHA